jgi:hypothetical protein
MLALAAMFAQSPVRAAAAGEKWTAVSTTPLGVTGDVTFAPDRITFGNGKSLALAPAGAVPKFEARHGNSKRHPLQGDGAQRSHPAPRQPPLRRAGTAAGHFYAIWKPARIRSNVDPRSMAAFSGARRRPQREARASAERIITKPAKQRRVLLVRSNRRGQRPPNERADFLV